MLDYTYKNIDVDLEYYGLVCVQHILPSTIYLLQRLLKIGFKPENIHILGKSYSTITSCIDIIKDLGINYYSNLRPNSYGDFKKFFIKDIKRMWKQINFNHFTKISKLLVLDDGGLCITNTPYKIIKNYKIIGIEQTQNGLDIIKRCKISYPIINIASSAAKKNWSPI